MKTWKLIVLVKQAGVIDPSVTVNVADYVAVNKDNRINNEFGKTVGPAVWPPFQA